MCPNHSNCKIEKKINPKVITAEYFFVKNEYKFTRVDFKDILYIEGMGDYQCIHTLFTKIMTLQTFEKIAEKLPKKRFFRIHRSYIVSIEKISVIEKNHVIINNKDLPIGQKYKEDFFCTLENQRLI